MDDNIIKELLDGISQSNQIKNDNDLRKQDIKSLGQHTEDYDTILRNYSTHVEKTLCYKRRMKTVFFIMSIIIMVTCIVLVCICIYNLLTNISEKDYNVINYIAPTITSITSFLTIYIVIPKIIAQYLYDSKEETAMREIISSIQEYDKYVRKSLNDTTS